MVHRIVATPPHAALDGGDVLCTGREIFVGVGGGRTDDAGCRAVAAAFPHYPVHAVPMMLGVRHTRGRHPAALHLKSLVVAVDERLLIAEATP